MNGVPLFRIVAVVAVSIATATLTQGQNASQTLAQSTSPAKPHNHSKPHKVWTDDDVSTLRTPADIHLEREQRQADAASASGQGSTEKPDAVAPDKKPASSKAESSTRPPLLSNPKTVDDADAMLAWEGRDLHDQSEFVDGLQDRIDQTSDPDEKARLTKTLEERQRVLATIRKEIGELQAERKALQNKSASGTTASATRP
jgi:hypothetical protein